MIHLQRTFAIVALVMLMLYVVRSTQVQLKAILRLLGVTSRYWELRDWWSVAPIYLANFLFQRLIGINRRCPWSVHFTSTVVWPDRIILHAGVVDCFALSGGCYIQASNGLELGEGARFAAGVKIITANHNIADHSQYDSDEPVRIGKRCWIGANATILPGVQLGERVIVGAGSVVTKSFPSHCVIGGVPARILRLLDQEQRVIQTSDPI